ncbi:MAG: hypothetical protein OXG44_21860, partial [Gammaproteobacteria bacterium]|nr:hypothetical protein [Gammaproteobacteria bacterium]
MGVRELLGASRLETLPDHPAIPRGFLPSREIPEFDDEVTETRELRQVVEQPGFRLTEPQALLEDGGVGVHHA